MDRKQTRQDTSELLTLMMSAIPGTADGGGTAAVETSPKATRRFWTFTRLAGVFALLIFCLQLSYDVGKAWAKLEGVVPAHVRLLDAVGAAYTNQQLVALMIFSLVMGSAMGGASRWVLK